VILVEHATVVTVDAERRIYADGSVLTDGDRILQVGPAAEVRPPRTPDRVCQLVTPLKPVEAMASGLPVVVSAVNALSEIVSDKETGLTFPPLDAGALADQLQQVLDRQELRTRLGARAREWVARDRTWAHNAARYREAYRRLGAL